MPPLCVFNVQTPAQQAAFDKAFNQDIELFLERKHWLTKHGKAGGDAAGDGGNMAASAGDSGGLTANAGDGGEMVARGVPAGNWVTPDSGAPPPLSPASSGHVAYNPGARQSRTPTLGLLWCAILVVFGFLVEGFTAAAAPEAPTLRRQQVTDDVALANRLAVQYKTEIPNSELSEALAGFLDIGCDLHINKGCKSPIVKDVAPSKAFPAKSPGPAAPP